MYLIEKKKSRPDSVDCTPLDYILPGSNELPLTPLQPVSKDPKVYFIIFKYHDIVILNIFLNLLFPIK